MNNILDLSEAPEGPIQRIIWLSGVLGAVRNELNLALQDAYFEARVQGMFQQALDLHLHSQKRALAWTRHSNESRGRIVKQWRDGF